MLKKLAQIDRTAAAEALFVTLTYPLAFEVTFAESRVHWDRFVKRLQRRYPRVSVVWRVELTPKGQIHRHLIVYNVGYIPYYWVALAWYQVVGTGNVEHFEAGTEVRAVKNYRQTLAYAAKYAAKVADDETNGTEGRVWGIIGRKYLPASVIQWELDGRGETRLVGLIQHLARSRSRKPDPSAYPPRWVICHGRRGLAAVAWAAGLKLT